MRSLCLTLILCGSLGLVARCEAGGLFRRVPAVGEWARFDHTMTAQAGPEIIEKDVVENPVSEPIDSELIVKCVGEEQIEGVDHLWIELRWTTFVEGEPQPWVVIKVLAPAAEIVEGNFMEHVVRGWWQSAESPAAAFNPSGDVQGDDTVEYIAYMAFPHIAETTGSRHPRVLLVNNEETLLERSVSGEIADREFDDWRSIRDTARLWLSPDHAFGVAAVERTFLFENAGSEEDALRVEYNVTMQLVETGNGAVSDLPDNR
jgi:hypothetical protein